MSKGLDQVNLSTRTMRVDARFARFHVSSVSVTELRRSNQPTEMWTIKHEMESSPKDVPGIAYESRNRTYVKTPGYDGQTDTKLALNFGMFIQVNKRTMVPRFVTYSR